MTTDAQTTSPVPPLAAIDAELAARTKRPRSPAGLALAASRGRWQTAPHLRLLDARLTELAAGKGRRLIVTMPPRHGKSELCSKHLPAWFLATYPDRLLILCSYEAGFAAEWGAKARDVLAEHGPTLFGVHVREDKSARDDWGIEGREGGMITAGVGGAITGRGAHLLIVDDPVKNAEEANSPTYRDKTWQWFNTTAYTRLEPEASALIILTRWHEDDLAGRLLTRDADREPDGAGADRWEVLNLPALAEENDALGRAEGEPLWPARWPLETLRQKRRELGSMVWAALYQQRPAAAEGNYFKRFWFDVVDGDRVPKLKSVARAWDLAATPVGEKGNADPDWLAGVKMAQGVDEIYYVLDVKRERLSPEGVERLIKQTAELDGRQVKVRIEQEGAASGKLTAHHFTRMLDRFDARFTGIPRGSKFSRSGAFNAACERRDVRLVRGPWNEAFIEELAAFPNGKHDDQVDAGVGAYEALAEGYEDWTTSALRQAFDGPAEDLDRPDHEAEGGDSLLRRFANGTADRARASRWLDGGEQL